MLAAGRSFRSRFDRELVGFGFSSAEILADIEAHGREQTIRILLTPGRRKQITVNSVKKTASELAGTITAVLFCPEDLAIVREGASVRRKMLDNAISQLRPGYAAALTEYNRLYEQKSAILRDYREKPSLLYTLDDFSERMCRLSARLIRYRAAFASRLDEAAGPIHREFSGGSDELRLFYRTVSTVENPFASEREIYYAVCRPPGEPPQGRARERAVPYRRCTKDDLEIVINGKSARTLRVPGPEAHCRAEHQTG